MKPALIIIDMQKAFFKGYCKTSMGNASSFINEAIKTFRKKDLPIIWVQDINEKEGAIPNTKGFDIIDCLNSETIEYSVHKQNLDCFTGTNCTDILNEQHVDVVIIAGFCADYCVLSSYKGALQNGFTAAILKQAIAAGSEEDINKVVINNDTVSISLLKKMLDD